MNAANLIELVDGAGARALVNPLGAALLELELAGAVLMPQLAATAQPDWFAGVTLAPWPNRLAHARWRFAGKELVGAVNNPPDNAHHGLVFNKPFDVVERQPAAVQLECWLGDDAVYPFNVCIGVRYELQRGRLRVELTARNSADQRVPIALGGHPYIACGPADSLTVNAGLVLESDAAMIPNGRTASLATRGLQSGRPTPIAELQLDDCFSDLPWDAAGHAHCVISRPDGSQIDVWQEAGFGYTMVYIHRDFFYAQLKSDAIAIEPQTAPANALNSGEGLIWLEPGADWRGVWGIDFQPATA